ncbi:MULTISPECIES: anti-sigma factor [Roseobacteraceae]|uniref:anti-sigma factor family protein n=1 Tax=Roseobacteraceae TaxID=2854170 RepID=UPI00125FFD5F|nr:MULTISPECIES: anti-sigma factor [Roseobacteraceae]KAB6715585.1 hypothetical protein C8029_14190 [Roseobacter sp. TSBP12]|tara:strand:+ start:3552 stop:4316 length:765 start_codon:yes stop_codon:yes gene_type:complete
MTHAEDFDPTLHRYADGEMTQDEMRTFEARMEANPALAARVAEVMALNEALNMAVPSPQATYFAKMISNISPDISPRSAWPRRAVAAVALLGIGLALGYWGGVTRSAGQGGVPESQLLASASAAHMLYTAEVLHPVDVSGDERDHLKTWLTKRLGAEVRIPTLTQEGFSLVGGRLLPAPYGAAAQFMYETGSGQRVTLYLTPTVQMAVTSLKFNTHDGLTAVSWQDPNWHYVLVGAASRSEMEHLAKRVHGDVI